MLKFDDTKLDRKEIIGEKKGVLTAQIVYNTLIKNNYRLWFIGNEDGTSLHYSKIGEGDYGGTIAWTSKELAEVYVNGIDVKTSLLRVYGHHISIANMSLYYLQSILNEHNAKVLGTLLINPNPNGFFTPLSMFFFKETHDYLDAELLGKDNIAEIDVGMFTYDKEEKKYLEEDFESSEIE